MTRFQLIFTGLLVALGIAGVVVFAMSKNKGEQAAPLVVMWGKVEAEQVSKLIADFLLLKKEVIKLC